MIKAVLFDLGGVVVDFSNSGYYRYLSRKTGIRAGRIRQVIERRRLVMLEKDGMDIRTFEGQIAREVGISPGEVLWYEFYKKHASINIDVQEVVSMLHGDYVTAFLSNIDKTRYFYTMKMLDLNLFDYRFASCYIKHRKPEPEVFRFALRKIGIRAEEAVFIDNMAENVDGARKVGMEAVHFVGRRMLDRQLAALGL